MWTDGQVVFSYTVYGVPRVDWVLVHVTQYGGQYMCTVVLWIVPVFELDGLWDFVCHPGFAAWHVQTVYRFTQSRIQLTLYHAFSWTKANVTELLGVLESAHSISYTAFSLSVWTNISIKYVITDCSTVSICIGAIVPLILVLVCVLAVWCTSTTIVRVACDILRRVLEMGCTHSSYYVPHRYEYTVHVGVTYNYCIYIYRSIKP